MIFALIGWAAVGTVLVAQLATYLFLHEDPSHRSRRRWKTFVILAGVFAAAASGLSTWRSGVFQHGVAILQRTIAAQSVNISDLQRQLGKSTREVSREERALHDQRHLLAAADAEIHKQQRLIANDEERISLAQGQIARADEIATSLSGATLRARELASHAEFVANALSQLVAKTQAQTDVQLEEARRLASAAALKAGVYHLPRTTSSAIVASLRSTQPGKASIACAPGLEITCGELGVAFREGGWRATVIRAASFFAGGGLDATGNSDPDAGLIIWYGSAARAEMARHLADILRAGGVSAAVHSGSTFGDDISISLLFIAHVSRAPEGGTCCFPGSSMPACQRSSQSGRHVEC